MLFNFSREKYDELGNVDPIQNFETRKKIDDPFYDEEQNNNYDVRVKKENRGKNFDAFENSFDAFSDANANKRYNAKYKAPIKNVNTKKIIIIIMVIYFAFTILEAIFVQIKEFNEKTPSYDFNEKQEIIEKEMKKFDNEESEFSKLQNARRSLKREDIILKQYASEKLPEVASRTTENAKNKFEYRYENIPFSLYEDIVKDYKKIGFNIETMQDNESRYISFNNDNMELRIYYYEYNNSMRVSVEKIPDSETLFWNTYEVSKVLPEPPSKKGYDAREYDGNFSVILTDVNYEKFYQYVEKCAEMGFNKGAMRRNNSYVANNQSGKRLSIEYIGLNRIEIRYR